MAKKLVSRSKKESNNDHNLTAKEIAINIGKKFITNHKTINATEQAESIDLKQNFEKWDYKY